jgi:hypothetical protein
MAPPRRYADAAEKQRAYRRRLTEARQAEQAAKGLPPSPALPSLPSTRRWQALLEQARLALQTAHDEMQAYAATRSAAWQDSERAAALAEQVEALERALDELAAL